MLVVGSISDAWGRETPPDLSLSDRLKLLIRGKKANLRGKMLDAMKRLRKGIRILGYHIESLEKNEAERLKDLKRALREGDEDQAKVLAYEVNSMKKFRRVLNILRSCLYLLYNKLMMVMSMGDVSCNFRSLSALTKVVAPVVAKVLPAFQKDIMEIQEALDYLCSEMDGLSRSIPDLNLEDEGEARELMEAVMLSVEKEASEDLPDLEDLLEKPAGLRGIRKGVRAP